MCFFSNTWPWKQPGVAAASTWRSSNRRIGSSNGCIAHGDSPTLNVETEMLGDLRREIVEGSRGGVDGCRSGGVWEDMLRKLET